MEQVLKNTVGMSGDQITNGTPSDKRIVLKSFYKGDKCTISPAKDINGRYKGIEENIPDVMKIEMGYVPGIESKVKLYDGMEIDLSEPTWEKDWKWMKHCVEIAEDFGAGQSTRAAYFYIFRPGLESSKKVNEQAARVKLMNYILNDSAENLYNRASILGNDMSDMVISDVKEYLLDMVNTEPARIQQVYESKTFSLELLMMHALKKNVITKRGGVYTFGEILLGVEESAVVAYFANPKNHITTKAIESVTYGSREVVKNPLENEVVQGPEYAMDLHNVGNDDDGLLKNSAMDQDFANETPVVEPVIVEALTPQQKAAKTRAANAQKNKK
jgi:hypothetical protein